MIKNVSNIITAAIAGFVISEMGCSLSPTQGVGQSPVAIARQFLSADEAAQLAAKLANDQCDRQYHKRPFSAAQHIAILKKGMYQWGGLDVGAPGGYSVLVTFRPDGSNAVVEVLYSTDIIMMKKPEPIEIPLPPEIKLEE